MFSLFYIYIYIFLIFLFFTKPNLICMFFQFFFNFFSYFFFVNDELIEKGVQGELQKLENHKFKMSSSMGFQTFCGPPLYMGRQAVTGTKSSTTSRRVVFLFSKVNLPKNDYIYIYYISFSSLLFVELSTFFTFLYVILQKYHLGKIYA